MLHLGEDRVEWHATAQLRADVMVPTLGTAARRHQIAVAGQPEERQWLSAECDTEASQFGQSASDQRRLGVPSVAEAVGDAGGDGEHVLHGAADLAADHVGIGVHAQRFGHEQTLQRAASAPPRDTR